MIRLNQMFEGVHNDMLVADQLAKLLGYDERVLGVNSHYITMEFRNESGFIYAENYINNIFAMKKHYADTFKPIKLIKEHKLSLNQLFVIGGNVWIYFRGRDECSLPDAFRGIVSEIVVDTINDCRSEKGLRFK